MLEGEILGHEEEVVDGFAGPIAITEFFHGEEEHAAAERFAGAEEFLTFFIGGHAENRERAIVHAAVLRRRFYARPAAARGAETPQLILWPLPPQTELARTAL